MSKSLLNKKTVTQAKVSKGRTAKAGTAAGTNSIKPAMASTQAAKPGAVKSRTAKLSAADSRAAKSSTTENRVTSNVADIICRCGSSKNYMTCCGKYISGAALPETAEQLMRSRYTAYTQCNIDYIEATTRDAALADFDREQALHLAKSSTWLGLKVLEYKPHPQDVDQAVVKFDAYFSINGEQGHIHETSKFKRIDRKWYYVDGR